jgi:hypothetical protein
MYPILVMFGCLICAMVGLIFIEVRRIRKKLDQKVSEPGPNKTAA